MRVWTEEAKKAHGEKVRLGLARKKASTDANEVNKAPSVEKAARPPSYGSTLSAKRRAASAPTASDIRPPTSDIRSLTASDLIWNAATNVLALLRIPLETLKSELNDPLSRARLRNAAIHLSNHAEEILSLIQHIKHSHEIETRKL